MDLSRADSWNGLRRIANLSGTATDAFKPGQEPGASGPVGVASSGPEGGGAVGDTHAAGVDSGLGGLY
jgi:hypothetical protein